MSFTGLKRLFHRPIPENRFIDGRAFLSPAPGVSPPGPDVGSGPQGRKETGKGRGWGMPGRSGSEVTLTGERTALRAGWSLNDPQTLKGITFIGRY